MKEGGYMDELKWRYSTLKKLVYSDCPDRIVKKIIQMLVSTDAEMEDLGITMLKQSIDKYPQWPWYTRLYQRWKFGNRRKPKVHAKKAA